MKFVRRNFEMKRQIKWHVTGSVAAVLEFIASSLEMKLKELLK